MTKPTSGYSPDILKERLDVIFCGMNPATSAALDGHNFSHPNNRFWSVLHLAGFTGSRLEPHEERRLLLYGCGITAVVSRQTSRANDIGQKEFKFVRLMFEAKIRHYSPRSVAFLGKRAFCCMMGISEVSWGRQPVRFAGTSTWILPNPSGRNQSFALDALVASYTELHMALFRPGYHETCH